MQSQLAPDQYELILKYMQATSEEDFQSATRLMRQYNFNINTAINARFNQTQASRRNTNIPNRMQQEQNDDQIVRKYIQFIQKENESQNIISSTFNFMKNFTVGLLKLISEIILPETLLRKILRSKFYTLYKDKVKVNVQDDKLLRLLLNTKQKTYKSCFVVISPQNFSQCIVELLNKNDIVKKIRENFLFAGFVQGDNQIESIRDQRPPQVVICRFNIYKQLQIIKRFIGQQSIRQITVLQLQNFLEEGRNMHKRDKNVLVKYRNFIRRQYYGGQMQIEEEEQEEVNFIARQEDRHHIRQQNQQYERMAEEQSRRFEEMRQQQQKKRKQLQMLQEKQQERRCRKMSIPDQPTSGEIIRFSFRCPDGSNISRSFSASQKVQLIYYWVQTNQQIQLEDNIKRQFEIMYSYPPTPLAPHKDRLLKEVFDSNHEKLLIREL